MRKKQNNSPTPTPSSEDVYKSKKELISSIIKKKTKEKFLSESQRVYYDKLTKSEITICSGPAGVGKSYIAMKAAIDLLADPSTPKCQSGILSKAGRATHFTYFTALTSPL